jgi:membrane-associated phospholipid phosphatase
MRRSPRNALLAAFLFAGALLLTWAISSQTSMGRWLDTAALSGFADLSRPRLVPILNAIASLAHPESYALLGLALCALALARERPRIALAIPLILLAASGTTEVLKQVFAEPRFIATLGPSGHIADASFPSGHATASMALALCGVLAVGPRLRPLAAAVGAAFAIAVTYSILILQWHFPSDTLGGFLIAGAWTLVGVAGLWAADRRWPAHTGRAAVLRAREAIAPSAVVAPTAAAVAGAVLCAGLVALARPHAVLAFANLHTVFVAGALAIGALGLALAIGLALTLRR